MRVILVSKNGRDFWCGDDVNLRVIVSGVPEGREVAGTESNDPVELPATDAPIPEDVIGRRHWQRSVTRRAPRHTAEYACHPEEPYLCGWLRRSNLRALLIALVHFNCMDTAEVPNNAGVIFGAG